MHGFGTMGYVILVLYIGLVVYIGGRFTKKQNSLEEYFVAGRSIPWWAAGISIITADMSAISYMGAPAYAFQKDLQLVLWVLLFPLIMLMVVYLFVPFLVRLKLYTIYEYLERRFGQSPRVFASGMFMLLLACRLSIAIYVPSLVLAVLTKMPLHMCILITGGVTALYTILGGMEAVIWTDVMQFGVLMLGLVAMGVAIILQFHGNVGQIWHLASQGHHTRMITTDFSLTKEVTIWGLIIGMVVINLSVYSSDQVVVQRYLTCGSKRDMVRAIMAQAYVSIPLIFILYFLGIGLAAYYASHPALTATLDNPQRVVPHFIANVLHPAVGGLVIAGIFAATMSSLSCGLNSLTTASIVDFYLRMRGRSVKSVDKSADSASRDLKMARWYTIGWALILTFGAMWVSRLGTIIEAMLKINSFFTGPLLGMFLLGILTKRTNTFGVMAGAIIGTITAGLVSTTAVSWLWYGPVGCAVTMSAGYCLSHFAKTPSVERILPLTLMGRPDTTTEPNDQELVPSPITH